MPKKNLIDDYDFAELIRELRRVLAISQKELAALIDVTSDTVSRWELRKVVPRDRQLKQVLNIANQKGVSLDQFTKLRQPVRSLYPYLPLDDENLSWQRFQDFCEHFISLLPGVIEVHQYGVHGEKQKGIDLYAELENGELWSFQCRQRKRFNKTSFEKTFKETSFKADRHIILVSCEANTTARDACSEYTIWDIWDIRDISKKTRRLSKENAKTLVDTFFGGQWRQIFLGLQKATPFITADVFFRGMSDEKRIFNHTVPQIGREKNLKEVDSFVQSDKRIAMLIGRGGIGKTKLLYEFSKNFYKTHMSSSLFFLSENVPIDVNSFEHLPISPCIIVIDDADRFDEDVSKILALAKQHQAAMKFLFSLRPTGTNRLKGILSRAGFGSNDIQQFEEVSELTLEETKKLASEVMPNQPFLVIDQLAKVTRDCPLITVVGGKLLEEQSISPQLLERNEDFQFEVLKKFEEEIVGSSEDGLDRKLLYVISATQPIYLEDNKYIKTTAAFLNTTSPAIISAIGDLEKKGILICRGNSIRIFPDLLSDHILFRACFTNQAISNGFANTVFEKYGSVSPERLLINLAKLDWRVTNTSSQETNLLEQIWKGIFREFGEGSHVSRIRMLGILRRVGFYQPNKMLKLVEYGKNNPAESDKARDQLGLFEYTHQHILEQIPPILKYISYTIKYLPRCCELLWDLGIKDKRRLNSNADHALRILESLASYDIGKPVETNETVTNFIISQLAKETGKNQIEALLKIGDRLLEKESDTTFTEGHTLTMYPFGINRNAVLQIRQSLFGKLKELLCTSTLGIQLIIISSLGRALREPVQSRNKVTDAEKKQWETDQLLILNMFEKLILASPSPIALIRINDAVEWQAAYGPLALVKTRATEIVSSIEEGHEYLLTEVLLRGYDRDLIIGDERLTFEGREEKRIKKLKLVAQRFIVSNPDAITGARELNRRLEEFEAVGVDYTPGSFLHVLSMENSEYAQDICTVLIGNSEWSLSGFIGTLLSNIIRKDPAKALRLTETVLESGTVEMHRSIVQSRFLANTAGEQQVALLKKLLDHPDIYVKKWAIDSLRLLERSNTHLAIDLALGVDLQGNHALADELCSIFGDNFGIGLSDINDGELTQLTNKLEVVGDIDGYHIGKFLGVASKRIPDAVMEMLLKRLEYLSDPTDESYRPIPLLGFQEKLEGFAENSKFKKTVEQLCHQAQTELVGKPYLRFWLPKLFKEITQNYNAKSVQALDSWMNPGDPDSLKTVGLLIEDAYPNFIFEEADFVSNLLEYSYANSIALYDEISSRLFASARSGTHWSNPGSPAPRDISMRDQAKQVKSNHHAGSPVYRFYDEMEKQAKHSIEESLARDEEYEYRN